MLEYIKPELGLVFDIETVPMAPDFGELPDTFKELWEKKAEYLRKEDETLEDSFVNRGGIYAEFGKIVCISAGFFVKEGEHFKFRLTSFSSDDEVTILKGFHDLLQNHFNKPNNYLCGHNVKEFDVPYVCRRMLIHGIALPNILNIAGKKPWEVNHVDTMELWKFGDYKSYTSLKLLTALFGIPTPKDDIEGSDVGRVYWQEKDLPRIAEYCGKDVVATAQLLLRYKGLPMMKEEDITQV